MLNGTRTKYDQYTQQIGKLNGVTDPSRSFTVAPAVAQTLRAKLKQSSDFLSRINIIPVVAQEGDKVGVGVKGTIASRTDTRAKDRAPRYPGDLDESRYRCEKTDFDTLIRYETMDAWAHQPNFQTLLRDAIVNAKAIDIITIGFNGVTVAATTNPTTYPLLQDVNKGWLQHIREDSPERHMAGGELKPDERDATTGRVTKAGAIYVGAGEVGKDVDFVNIDALVFEGIELLHENYREDTDLVAIVGRELVHDKYFSIVNAAGDKATEQLARDVLLSDKKIGGLTAVRVPKFPKNAILITTLANLSVYEQIGTERRKIEDNAKRDQIENYESVNHAYVVEDEGKAALIENIVMGKKPAA
ncbi:phage major capsid protein, P2 family [Sphingomonas pseudosanguinis]|uniref:P2 family phage major capsid protein n=1 Tax=Sphingomonas pseudosanguinis TaxID=413712 RepID=A0A7W6ABX2_9SPHN|nr:phage major capsid protein, P2 family [Sphingomonas pseudosanguinis]MBB3877886.1 P2 family phage major capsid protein [Sphingomonas pseudosanguinis]MBN3537760.1 phage major capsid protein, P2 family [Sphingomonas pseudosanguinis]